MKAFVISCILFLFLCGGAVANDIYLSKTAEAMKEKMLPLAEEGSNDRVFFEIMDEWDRKRLFFSASMHYNELESLETAFARAETALKIESDSEYQLAVAESVEGLSRIRELNSLSPFGLL